MTAPPYRVVVTTSDKYLPALRPLAWLMEKYWKPMPEVVVCGFTPPDFDLPEKFKFVSVGKQEDYPWDKWSDAVIHLLHHHVPDEVFVLILEDMWPMRMVNTRALEMLYHYMIQFEYVARIDLTTDRLYAHGMVDYAALSWIDLIKSMPGSPYHCSLSPAMWRREHLLSTLIPGENAHQVELQGTTRLSHNQDVIVLGSRQCPYRNCLALRGGSSAKLEDDQALAFKKMVNDADLKALTELGYLEPWE